MDEARQDSIEGEDAAQEVSDCTPGSPSIEGKFARYSTISFVIVHTFALFESEDDLDEEPWVREKKLEIVAALKADPVNINLLRILAVTEGGFLCNSLRRKVWPKLLAVNPHRLKKYAGQEMVR